MSILWKTRIRSVFFPNKRSGARWISSRDNLNPANERQRKSIERFRQTQEYSEQYTNLKNDPSGWLEKYSKAMGAIKPLNHIGDVPWTLDNLKMIIGRTKRNLEIKTQEFDHVRYMTLGYDIGAAHFVVYRRGAVKFYDKDWIRWTTEAKYSEVEGLPFSHIDGYTVEAIDLTNVDLYYEGLENLKLLNRLKHLNLAGNYLVNDWYLDVISNFNSLESLGLCNCPGVSHRGIATLYKLDNLKCLYLRNEKQKPSGEMNLALLNLLDYKPDLLVDIDPTHGLSLESNVSQ